MTAIAAVLAFSSTSLFAQNANVAQPSVETPAPLAETLAPEPATSVASEAAPEPVADPLAPEAKASAATVTKAATPARSATRATRGTPRPTAHAAPARTTTVATGPVAAAAPVKPEEPAPAPLPLAAPVPLAAIIAPATAPVGSATVAASEDVLPIAGAAGLGLLALLGAGAVVRRRRRHAVDEYVADEWNEPACVAPAATAARPATPIEKAAQPAFGWPAAPAPAAIAAARAQSALPDGNDEASLGHHVAAAYRGPSADNPSLSLKKRIKRAIFFDQRERLARAGQAVAVAPGAGLPAAMARKVAPIQDGVKPSRLPAGLESPGGDGSAATNGVAALSRLAIAGCAPT